MEAATLLAEALGLRPQLHGRRGGVRNAAARAAVEALLARDLQLAAVDLRFPASRAFDFRVGKALCRTRVLPSCWPLSRQDAGRQAARLAGMQELMCRT